MRWVAVALSCVFLLAGCTPNDDSPPASTGVPTSTATPGVSGPSAFPAPPSAFLKDPSGNAVEGFTGTYCWQVSQRGDVCADYSPWGTSKSLIPLRSGQPLDLIVDAGTPREVKLRWLVVDNAVPQDFGSSLDWTPQDYRPGEMATELVAPRAAGRYALEVFTLFREGDVTYGFYVEVR